MGMKDLFRMEAAAGPTPREKRQLQQVCTPVRNVVTTQIPNLPEPVRNVVTTQMTRLPEQLPALKTDYRTEALERLQFLDLVESMKRQRRDLRDPEAVQAVAVQYVDQFRILLTSGHGGKGQLTYQNYRNWKRLLRQASPAGNLTREEALQVLAPRYHTGRKEQTAGDPKFWEELCKFFLHPNKPDLTECRRIAANLLRKRDPMAVVPSISQCYYYVRNMPVDVVIRGREGETAWRNSCCDYIQRDWTDTQPGELLIGDSRTFDTWVKIWDDDKQEWKPIRPTIAALMDARSWYLAGWEITVDPVNAETLIDTLAQYILNNGNQPPAMCYFDNGKDYCAQGFATPLNVEGFEHSIFNELGIKLTNATAFNARAKTVERFFQSQMNTFDKRFPAYLGSNALQRPDAADYFAKHPEELPTLEDFEKLFRAWLNETHAMPKGGRIHRGKSPSEIWEARPARPVWSDEALAFAFLRPVGIRTVGRGPSVTINGELYYSDEVSFGEKLLVKSSQWDRSMVLLCDPDGTPRGIARTREAVKAIAGDDAAQRALLSDRIARQRRQSARVVRMLQKLTGGDFGVSVIEYVMSIGADQRFIKRDAILKVKGKEHHYRRLAPAKPVFSLPEPNFDYTGSKAKVTPVEMDEDIDQILKNDHNQYEINPSDLAGLTVNHNQNQNHSGEIDDEDLKRT